MSVMSDIDTASIASGFSVSSGGSPRRRIKIDKLLQQVAQAKGAKSTVKSPSTSAPSQVLHVSAEKQNEKLNPMTEKKKVLHM